VVYNGLLKKERQAVHERIGQVMEELFRDRLPEIYETLPFITKKPSQSQSGGLPGEVGRKSLKRYAVEESHHYLERLELLNSNREANAPDKEALIGLLIKWAFVYYYAGQYRKLQELFEEHKNLAESLQDKSMLGIFMPGSVAPCGTGNGA